MVGGGVKGGEPLLLGGFQLFVAEVLLVGGYDPAVALGILELADAVSPEHVRHGEYDLAALLPGAVG